jgi:hypothetical protein
MFISARSDRMKASVKQRVLQSVSAWSHRPASVIGLIQHMSIGQVMLFGAVLIVLVGCGYQLQFAADLHYFVMIAECVLLVLGALLFWRYHRTARGQVAAYAQRQRAATNELHALRQAIHWHYELASLATSLSLDELHRCATSQTMLIAGGNVHDLSHYQTNALHALSSMVTLRRSVLESMAWREQQRTALDALWQIAGLLRVPDAARTSLLQQPCTRFAIALDLDWLVVLAPGLHAPIVPVLTIFGQATPGTTMNAALLRIAAEALRCEQPLMRYEGAATVACLPVLRSGHAPMVLVARGAAEEEATQSMLMLLGDLLINHYQLSYEWGA